jgi:hypothetical protein
VFQRNRRSTDIDPLHGAIGANNPLFNIVNRLLLGQRPDAGEFCWGGTELEFVIMVIAVSCVKLLSAHNSTQHTSRKHKV